MTKKTLKEYEAEWIIEKLRGPGTPAKYVGPPITGQVSYGADVIEELNKAIVSQIMSTVEKETPKIQVVSGLVHIVEDGTFLDELNGALNDRRRRSGRDN